VHERDAAADRAGLRHVERADNVADRAGGDRGVVERGQPRLGIPATEHVRKALDQLGAVEDAGAVRGEAPISGELGRPDRLAEPLPLAFAADADRDRPVGRWERLVRDDARVGVPKSAWC
jgi:hypothetical protein